MNSTPKSSAAAASPEAAARTNEEGLPLGSLPAALPAAADAGDGGPSRRLDLDCLRPPPLLSALPLGPVASKAPPTARQPVALTPGTNDGSLMDDDDDELVDWFGAGAAAASAPRAAADAAPAPSSLRWNVREHNVRALPSFYPLEQTAAFVPQASAPILAGRIAAVLEALSITADYDAQNAKVDCVARSHVQFRIRLYRGRGEFGHGIVVEVQRRAGFDLGYAQDVFAILDAAEGRNAEGPAPLHPVGGGQEGVLEFPTLRHTVLSPQVFENGTSH